MLGTLQDIRNCRRIVFDFAGVCDANETAAVAIIVLHTVNDRTAVQRLSNGVAGIAAAGVHSGFAGCRFNRIRWIRMHHLDAGGFGGCDIPFFFVGYVVFTRVWCKCIL